MSIVGVSIGISVGGDNDNDDDNDDNGDGIEDLNLMINKHIVTVPRSTLSRCALGGLCWRWK